MPDPILSHGELLELKRWNTPTIYNGWEAITKLDSAKDCFSVDEVRDFMPQMGPMVGYAVTVQFEPSNAAHPQEHPEANDEYFQYVAAQPGPKIVVLQDLDEQPGVFSFWGEVNSNTHRALGCVGTITDGAIRDVDEMTNAGFKAIARRLCVGHGHAWPLRWGADVEVFGRTVSSGDLIHADKHGFMVIPPEDQARLLEAAIFMDHNECQNVIRPAREAAGKTTEEVLAALKAGRAAFRQATQDRFGADGEW